MKHNDNIHNELDSLGMQLLINKIACPFEVPANYFEHFAKQVNVQLSLDHISNEPQITKAMADNQNFSVPEGYFEGFAQSILQKIHQSESEQEIDLPQLAMPFESPSADYFDRFVEQVLMPINIASDASLSIGKIAHPFELPYANYFQDQVTTIVQHVANNELADAPILSTLGKSLPYIVPSNYFESFEVVPESSKVIAFEPSKRKKVMSLAAAAAVALLLTFGVSSIFNNNADVATGQNDIATLMVSISPEAIDEYIDVNLEEFANTALATNFINDEAKKVNPKFQAIMNEISTEEINEYFQIVE